MARDTGPIPGRGLRRAGATLARVSMLASLLLLLTLSAGGAAAESAEGTWTSRTPGEGFVQDSQPADSHYDVKLTLSGGAGTWWMKVVRVTNVLPGFESMAQSTVGKTFSYRVSYTQTPSGIDLRMEGMTLPLRVSGGRMTGSGSYRMPDGSTVKWTVDLVGGSGAGALGVAAGAAAVVGIVGGAAGVAASLAPPPARARGHPAAAQFLPPGQLHPYPAPQVPQQSYWTASPVEARATEPSPFSPPPPSPDQMQMAGGAGIQPGQPYVPPPPTPPHGGETLADPNPTCPICHMKTLPRLTSHGYRWYCEAHGFPWG